MVEIVVSKSAEDESKYTFEVELNDKSDSTAHKVTLDKEHYKSLGTETSPSDIIRKSFKFLLKRESKESILGEFDIRLISNYFPEFDSESSQF